MKGPLYIDSDFIETNTDFHELVEVLRTAFSQNITVVPQRHHHDFSNPGTITTIEGAGFYPQAGINFLLGATVNF